MRSYEKEAIIEFSRFREARLKRITLGAFFAVTEQQRQIRDMTRKAFEYF